MATLNVPETAVTLTDPVQIRDFLEPHGIFYERWESEGRASVQATSDEILAAYDKEIERLKRRGGYVTADVIDVLPDTPGLDAMLEKFNKEHTHDEDEVRFVVEGSGIFHINPVTAPVFSIEMEPGDLISVPRGTRHWFNLCQERRIRAIRLFQEASGWAPHYIESGVHGNFDPVCLGPAYLGSGRLQKHSPVAMPATREDRQ